MMDDLPDYLVSAVKRYAAEEVREACGMAADGKPYCDCHRVNHDEQQSEQDDKCLECGRTRPEHRHQMSQPCGVVCRWCDSTSLDDNEDNYHCRRCFRVTKK